MQWESETVRLGEEHQKAAGLIVSDAYAGLGIVSSPQPEWSPRHKHVVCIKHSKESGVWRAGPLSPCSGLSVVSAQAGLVLLTAWRL